MPPAKPRHVLLALWALAALAFLYLPVVFLVVYSFNDAALGARWQGFTFRWYTTLWRDTTLLLKGERI